MRCLLAGIGMALAVLAIWFVLDGLLPDSSSTLMRTTMELISAGFPAAVGAMLFAYLMHRMNVREAAELRRTVLGKVHPRLAR